MPKSHPDFAAARGHLSNIMQKIIKGSYKDKEDYVTDMHKWAEHWSDPEKAAACNTVNQLQAIGNQNTVLCILIKQCR